MAGYIGNNDYRGYLNYLGQNGDTMAGTVMQLVGNDGRFGDGGGSPLNSEYIAANDNYYYNYLNGGSGGRGTTAGSGAEDTSAADMAYLDDQEGSLRGMLGSARNTLNDGLTQIGDSFNKETQRTNQQKATAQAGYATKREDTTRDKLSATGRVNTGARTLADSVRRMLGMASGQNSSAFRETAPGAIARDAGIKRTGVNETFGRNFRDIDTAETGTMDKFKQYMEDLGEQRKQKESGLREGVLSQEQQIYNSLGQISRDKEAVRGGSYDSMRRASAPYQAEANNRQSALDGLFNQFRTPVAAKDVQVATPNLSEYTVDRSAVNANAQSGAAAPYSPYSQFLKKKFQQQPS